MITPEDLYLFDQGSHGRLYEQLGAHPVDGGVRFGVWAPEAAAVSVVGPWNQWIPGRDPLERAHGSDLWSGMVPRLATGERYKLHIEGRTGYRVDKADPFAFAAEPAPATASIVTSLDHAWGDAAWMRGRARVNADDAPIAIYEVHLGSWLRDPADPARLLSYGELAPRLAEHATTLGFSHVELLPVMEHPFYGSWGYQTTGYFAATARYGSPADLMALIDLLHREGIAVILDWVPSHFPDNEHGLVYFDGSHAYEHADPRRRLHPEWDSMLFNYDRPQVRSFLLSSALFWLDRYHADGLRVDGVASMLHLDYARGDDYVRNIHGGNEDLGAIQLLRTLNTAVAREHPGAITIAEESTEWPGVTADVAQGGLGFGMKWDMGWMHDTLNYFQTPIAERGEHHGKLTFRGIYAYTERFLLPLSHDEVVHGKRSLLDRMPGDAWQRLANLRLLFAWMYAQPGKKLLFMGGEFGQLREWDHDRSLDWHLVDDPAHAGIGALLHDLNRLLRELPALHARDFDPGGFRWLDADDSANATASLLRAAPNGDTLVAAFNFTAAPRHGHRIGLPRPGGWRERLNTDAAEYGGSGVGNAGGVMSEPVPWQGCDQSAVVTLPPLGAVWLAGR
ncbi:MAG TPA: 1,4-alpha-glucan branching protein GlgB [Candidatus Saccharimonadales bacterium]|nr:1,4-alpha-glucan branching protein GlgB [Candidatus Saccharimonadales bacterium]